MYSAWKVCRSPPPLYRAKNSENTDPANPTPTSMPRFLAVARIPEAMPVYRSSTLERIEALFGDKKIACPAPRRDSLTRISMIGVCVSNRAIDTIARQQTANPDVVSILAPM